MIQEFGPINPIPPPPPQPQPQCRTRPGLQVPRGFSLGSHMADQ
jgi:hypothetical protein